MTSSRRTARASTPRVAWNLVRNDRTAYAISWTQWVLFHMSPLAVGFLLKLVLDHLVDPDPGVPVLLLVAIVGAVTIGKRRSVR